MAVAPHKLSGGAQWSSVEEARWGQPAPHAPVELSLILEECSKSVSEVADCLKGSVCGGCDPQLSCNDGSPH